MEIDKIIEQQKLFFSTGLTINYKYRVNILKQIEKEIKNSYEDILKAFKKDLNKCEFDVLSTELLPVLNEIKYMKKHLKKLMEPKKVRTSLLNMRSNAKIFHNPLGTVLIVAPWNYPFNLTFMPLIGAISAGNTAVVKPSAYAPNVSAIIKKILSIFDDEYISVVEGGREQNIALFEKPFDFIFFTGSPSVGKTLMECSSKNKTPVLLELGGKSPCIVDIDADIKMAAKRIVWGKYLNAGQTCVAPDYVWAHKEIKNKLLDEIKYQIRMQFYSDGTLTSDFPNIICQKHIDRLIPLIDKEKLAQGGAVKGLQIEPTVLDDVSFSDSIMKEEIFGPILPIITFDSFDELCAKQMTLEKPLALYYFGNNQAHIKFVENRLAFGGGCINDVIMHLVEDNLPFGGVGNSGMGAYHGKKSFEVFTHDKSVLNKKKCELQLKYQPSSPQKIKLLKYLLKIK